MKSRVTRPCLPGVEVDTPTESPMLTLLLALTAQASPTVDVGLTHRQVRDDVLVPLRYSGGGLTLGSDKAVK